jgi:GT2 family glycosyltransferase
LSARVYILLPVHNRKVVTEGLIRCLAAQTYRDLRLVLIDDGSIDGTAEMVLGYLPNAVVLRGQGDWWWAGSLQQGLQWLRSENASPDDFVLIMNDDTTVAPDFVERGVVALRGRTRTLLLAQLYDRDTGNLIECGVHLDWQALRLRATSAVEEVNCFSTRGLFLRVGDMFEIGAFHPVLLPHYTSDYEYTVRAVRKGFALLSISGVRLSYDKRTTGMRQFEAKGLIAFLRTIMSKRATDNPIYLSVFVLLACPIRYVPINVFRVWRSFAVRAIRATRCSTGVRPSG